MSMGIEGMVVCKRNVTRDRDLRNYDVIATCVMSAIVAIAVLHVKVNHLKNLWEGNTNFSNAYSLIP